MNSDGQPKGKSLPATKDESQDYIKIDLTGEQKSRAVVLSVLGWFIPGAGHWYLKKYSKGIIFFLVLNGLFLWGMLLHGEIAFPILNTKSPEFNFVNILVFIFGCANGGMTLLNMLPFAHLGDISKSTYEVGSLFMVVSGSLNVFVVMNAFDLFREEIASTIKGKKK